jgi:hypothetical protein
MEMKTNVGYQGRRKCQLRNNNIIIQQDGASAHLPEGDPFVFSKGGRELFGNQSIKKMLSNPTLNQLNHQIKMSWFCFHLCLHSQSTTETEGVLKGPKREGIGNFTATAVPL